MKILVPAFALALCCVGFVALSTPITDSTIVEIDRYAPVLTARLPPVEPVRAAAIEPNELRCLALNIYFEARNEPRLGLIGVGHVVLNRVADKHYPNSVCAVITQGRKWKGKPVRDRCAFSWFCNGKSDDPKNMLAWETSTVLAKAILKKEISDPTNGSLMYHADYVNPKWSKDYIIATKIGLHIFYRRG